MKMKKILMTLVMVPALLVVGCFNKDDDGDDEVVYSEVSQAEVVNYLNQVGQSENMEVEGYNFKLTMAIPNLWGELSNDEEIWPDISNKDEWQSVEMNGQINLKDSLEAKYEVIEEGQRHYIYIKDNGVYMNSEGNKYMMTYDNDDELQYSEFTELIGSFEHNLEEQIKIVNYAEEGLKFEKGSKDGKTYYHIYGEVELHEDFYEDEGGDTLPMMQINISMPMDLYLTFENDKLIGYNFKTLSFIYMEFEVDAFSQTIEFPSDLNTYVENRDAFFTDEEFE